MCSLFHIAVCTLGLGLGVANTGLGLNLDVATAGLDVANMPSCDSPHLSRQCWVSLPSMPEGIFEFNDSGDDAVTEYINSFFITAHL